MHFIIQANKKKRTDRSLESLVKFRQFIGDSELLKGFTTRF